MNEIITQTASTSFTKKERDITLDILKGFAILLVVLGHVISGVFNTEAYSKNLLFKICYSFHMPLFIFISGWLNGKKPLNSLNGTWIKKRTLRLMLPYIIWTLTKWFIYREALGSPIKCLFVEPLFWFIIFIYLCSCTVFLSNKTGHIYIGMLLSYIIILIAWLLWQENHIFKSFIGNFPFYFLGFLGSRLQLNQPKVHDIKRYTRISLVLYPLSMLLYSHNEEAMQAHTLVQSLSVKINEQYVTIIWKIFNKYIIAVLGICFCFTIAEWMVQKKLFWHFQRLLAFLGIYTIQIYLLHDFFFVRSFSNSFLNSLVSFWLSLALSVSISLMIQKFPKLCRILFGQ